MAPLNKDLHFTAEFITLLRSGFYGQILFDGALDTLQSPLLPKNYLETAHKAFDKIDVWMKDLASELPIFALSWSSPETFDAISAMSFIRDLKRDIEWLIPQVQAALHSPDLTKDQDSVKLLVAALIRSAATRSSYVETLTAVLNQLNAPELARQSAIEIDSAKEYVRITQIILDTFNTRSAYDKALCEQLRAEASLTPCDLRALAHDATILMHVYVKEFTYDLAGFSSDEAQDWIDQKIPAVAAGYWQAYDFSPSEFIEWYNLGISGAPLAANWRRAKFPPSEAVEWIKEGVGPAVAIQWRAAGFDPVRTAALLRRGITDPKRAPQQDSGDDASDDNL